MNADIPTSDGDNGIIDPTEDIIKPNITDRVTSTMRGFLTTLDQIFFTPNLPDNEIQQMKKQIKLLESQVQSLARNVTRQSSHQTQNISTAQLDRNKSLSAPAAAAVSQEFGSKRLGMDNNINITSTDNRHVFPSSKTTQPTASNHTALTTHNSQQLSHPKPMKEQQQTINREKRETNAAVSLPKDVQDPIKSTVSATVNNYNILSTDSEIAKRGLKLLHLCETVNEETTVDTSISNLFSISSTQAEDDQQVSLNELADLVRTTRESLSRSLPSAVKLIPTFSMLNPKESIPLRPVEAKILPSSSYSVGNQQPKAIRQPINKSIFNLTNDATVASNHNQQTQSQPTTMTSQSDITAGKSNPLPADNITVAVDSITHIKPTQQSKSNSDHNSDKLIQPRVGQVGQKSVMEAVITHPPPTVSQIEKSGMQPIRLFGPDSIDINRIKSLKRSMAQDNVTNIREYIAKKSKP